MKIVLIGHGMVGHKFLESLAETGMTGVEVTVLCEEPRPAYDRVHLSAFFSGTSADELSLVEPGFFERTHTPPARCCRQTHALGQFGIGQAAIVLQFIQDGPVEFIHCFQN